MKRLVFCFDGTWNRIDAPHPTNVLFTAESVIPIDPNNVAQLIYYDEGVGTGKGEKLRGGAFGAGLEKNLNDAYRFLVFNHTPGDEIYLFGFSRGAFTARSFAGLISRCGILGRGRISLVNGMMERYFARTDNDAFELEMRPFRAENCPDVCISDEENDWRAATIAGYRRRPLLSIRYVGVWDTVGSRGIPRYVLGSSLANRKYEFHDWDLSPFVHAARHAVAIDEYKIDFEPTLWANLHILNGARLFPEAAYDAPYQQKWFPGNHGSVGGGGDIRGLSDQALDWVWDGAQAAGLYLDLSERSNVYSLAPNDTDPLVNRTPKPGFNLVGWFFDHLPKRDRKKGPSQLFQLSPSARRRWHIPAQSLPEGKPYRPKTLALAKDVLDALNPASLGLGDVPPKGPFGLHRVAPKETISSIETHYHSPPPPWPGIHAANRYKLDDPPQLLVGQLLRVPQMARAPAWPALALQPAVAAQPAVAVPPEGPGQPATPTE